MSWFVSKPETLEYCFVLKLYGSSNVSMSIAEKKRFLRIAEK